MMDLSVDIEIILAVIATCALPVPTVLLANRDVAPSGQEKEYSRITIARATRPGVLYGLCLLLALVILTWILHITGVLQENKLGPIYLVLALTCFFATITIIYFTHTSNKSSYRLIFTDSGIHYGSEKSIFIDYSVFQGCFIEMNYFAMRTSVHYGLEVTFSNRKKIDIKRHFSGIFLRYIGIELIRRLHEKGISFDYLNHENSLKHKPLKFLKPIP